MDMEQIKEAVGLLVGTDNFAAIKKELMDLIATQDSMPRRFAGELTPLNALIRLEQQSREAFDNVMNIVDSRRKATPTSGKVDYQRDYMRQRRARLMVAVQIEELERGSRMSPSARVNYKRVQMEKWMKARDAYLEKLGELDWKQKNAAVAEFWSRIDTQLENQLIDLKHNRKQKVRG